jgi:hypothetical protein
MRGTGGGRKERAEGEGEGGEQEGEGGEREGEQEREAHRNWTPAQRGRWTPGAGRTRGTSARSRCRVIRYHISPALSRKTPSQSCALALFAAEST